MKLVSLHSCPRSGSSWIQSIFEHHPTIKTIFQPLFSHAFKNIINKNSTIKDFNNFVNGLINTNDEFCTMKSNFHINNNMVFSNEKQNINMILMKNVRYHNLIETFIQLYPNIKIIGLIRNPCATINSFINAKKEYNNTDNEWLTGDNKNINDNHFFGYLKWKQVTDIFLHIKEQYPNNIIITKYENIVDDPFNELNKICEFIEIDLHKDMSKFIIDSHKYTKNSDYSVYKSKDVKDKWKKELDKNIIKYIMNDIKNTKYQQFCE